jgi:hypothetical protein
MDTHDRLLAAFLSSSFFAEDEAMPVVQKLLLHPTSAEERALLQSYAAEEDGHARVIADHLARRGLPRGAPFWIQKVFRRFRDRTTLLAQFYSVEVIAGAFYGAMVARIRDAEARALLRRLLRDEARHIRLHRVLLARHISRLGRWGRARARLVLALFRAGAALVAWYQGRQLAPILGDAVSPLRAKIRRKLRADVAFLFGEGAAIAARPVDWWWRAAA